MILTYKEVIKLDFKEKKIHCRQVLANIWHFVQKIINVRRFYSMIKKTQNSGFKISENSCCAFAKKNFYVSGEIWQFIFKRISEEFITLFIV